MAVNQIFQDIQGRQKVSMVNAPILDFRNRIGDLARPNLFQVEIGFPQIITNGRPASGATLDLKRSVSRKKQVPATLDPLHLLDLLHPSL